MPFFTTPKDLKLSIDYNLYTPVQILFCCESDGKIIPMRVKISNNDESMETYNIDGITQTKELLGRISYRCLITCNNRRQAITLIFYVEAHIWVTPRY